MEAFLTSPGSSASPGGVALLLQPSASEDEPVLLHPPGVALLAEEDDGEGEAVEDEAPSVELHLEPSRRHLEERQFLAQIRRTNILWKRAIGFFKNMFLLILTCAVSWMFLAPVEHLAENSLGPGPEKIIKNIFLCFCV